MSWTRRNFLGSALAAGLVNSLPAGAKIKVSETEAKTEQETGDVPEPLPPGKRVGFAVVGLGNLALRQIIPALAKTRNAKLTAVVSGDPAKARQVAAEHGVADSSVYSYADFDRVRDNHAVDVIYIVLPNGMHCEYVVRAARAGKHVLCEKPMANSVTECEQMIEACKKAQRQLMVAYRIQYEPHNRGMRALIDKQTYGAVKAIEAVNCQTQGTPDQWRLKKKMAGGGSLPDIGLYCLNTARFLLGEEPDEVIASVHSTHGDPRFKEVEETVSWQMNFPSGVRTQHLTSYGAHNLKRYRVMAERGWFGMDPAFDYEGLQAQISHAEGKQEHREELRLAPKDQFATEMEHMADCVLQNARPYTPGEEGLQDQKIMEAIYRSAETGRPVRLAAFPGKDVFRGTVPT